MGNAEPSGNVQEDAMPSLVPAVDITFSRPSATVKGAHAGLRFRKLRAGRWLREGLEIGRNRAPVS
ncbi:hypothetical protein IWQ56_003295 [Coemansia nantahalensis]|nr:hypothetical protein IWQ56_003295 [Coemansia nantahalensis]